MSYHSTSLQVRPFHPAPNRKTEPIDDKPITGRERYQLECLVLGKVKRSSQLLLRTILDYLGGRADCFPSNTTLGLSMGVSDRRIRVILRDLSQREIIKSVCDRSIPSQRRLILIDHPHALKVLRILTENDYIAASNRALRAELCFPPKVHPGRNKLVHVGRNKEVHPGRNNRSTESYLPTTSSENPVVSPPPQKTEEPETCCARARAWLTEPDAPTWKLAAAKTHLSRCRHNS